MANVVVVGSQWGDEGKGKIVDWLSERADVVVRFQGGHNAGHTLVVDGKVYKLSLLPSGVVREGKLSIIGNGVVFDPHAFVAEVAKLKAQGVEVTPDSLKIADNAALILSLHRELDGFREDAASNTGTKIGTTGAASAPPMRTRSGRRAIRVMDLASLETLPIKIDRLLSHHNALREGLRKRSVAQISIEDLVKTFGGYTAVNGINLRNPRRRIPDHGRAFRLRETHDAQHDLWPRDADQRPYRHRRYRGQRPRTW